MDWSVIITQYAPAVGTIGVLGYLIYDRWTSGTSEIRKDIIADYKERRGQQDANIKDLQAQMQDNDKKHADEMAALTNRFVALEATLAEKDRHIASLTTILQGRNPELVQLLSEIKVSNEKIMDFMKKMYEKNDKDMKYQTDILEGHAWRDQSPPINLLKR